MAVTTRRTGPRQRRTGHGRSRVVGGRGGSVVTGRVCGGGRRARQAEDGIRAGRVTGVQTCALPIAAGALRPRFGDRVFGPGDDGYTAARPVWNAAVATRPAV